MPNATRDRVYAALFLRAYSLGGGTFTGIEAVSNGLQIMREPREQTGKRTMLYMAVSLAVTASGILLAYLLLRTQAMPGKTTNLGVNIIGRLERANIAPGLVTLLKLSLALGVPAPELLGPFTPDIVAAMRLGAVGAVGDRSRRTSASKS